MSDITVTLNESGKPIRPADGERTWWEVAHLPGGKAAVYESVYRNGHGFINEEKLALCKDVETARRIIDGFQSAQHVDLCFAFDAARQREKA